ncbi:NAD(+) diphosphatase [uncultured Rhodoblastus sp.]|uniref:NAD(+) diphosphatase n=1 Tax=uncultured Rhodoblastus sp. TaxID=543037 RepID=UPI0025ED4707|nr:NAD(+) diphosphatase [uncultured Rhodoblastus sp.]
MPDSVEGFAGNPLDRLSLLREDAAAVAQMAADPAAMAVVLVQSMPILRAEGDALLARHPLAQARDFGAAEIEVLLGRDESGPLFALLLPDAAAQMQEEADDGSLSDRRRLVLQNKPELQIRDLRVLAAKNRLTRPELAILGQAKSILHYHATHGFCARCGAPTVAFAAGWRRDCPACGARHFPRTDPVAIMLVVDGDFCLLGRARHFPEKMYSCLAGFIESGETLEEAVRREVFEESGIVVGAVRYAASQPWPFPASLMFGCIGQALSRDIRIDAEELEDCRWFTRAEARAMIEERHQEGLFAPGKAAIARSLLEHWLREEQVGLREDEVASIAEARAQKTA